LDKLLTYFFIAVALGADAFSLALGLGMGGPSQRAVLRTSFTVGIFHIFMPLAGLLVGSVLGVMAGRVATWIGGVILVILGLKMIWEGRPWRREVYSFRTARKALEKPGNVFSWGGILVLGKRRYMQCQRIPPRPTLDLENLQYSIHVEAVSPQAINGFCRKGHKATLFYYLCPLCNQIRFRTAGIYP
jgi:hypothetical protein